MGDSGGATTKNTGSSTLRLPEWYSGHLNEVANQGRDLYHWYTGDARNQPSLYVPQSAATKQGLAMQAQTAQNGQVAPAAQSEWLKTIQGQYLDPKSNPWLRDVADRAGYEAENRINSQYGSSGRAGSGAYANALADAQVGTRNALYAQNYTNERGNMMGALGMAPQQQSLQYADSAALRDVGAANEADQMANQVEQQRIYNTPWEVAGKYASILYGNPTQKEGTTTTTQRSSQSNKFDWAAFVGGLL